MCTALDLDYICFVGLDKLASKKKKTLFCWGNNKSQVACLLAGFSSLSLYYLCLICESALVLND